MSILSLPMSLDDLELAWLKESYCEGYGKTGKAIAARNYVLNPNAEVNTTSVSALGSTVTRDTTDKWSGSASYKCVTDGLTTQEGVLCFLGTNRKGRFKGSARVKFPNGAQYSLIYRHLNASGGGAIDTFVNMVGTGNWQYVETALSTVLGTSLNSGNEWFGIRVIGTQAVTFWVDELVLSNSSGFSPIYFDGSVTDNNVWTYDWEGTPNNSSSIKWAKEPVESENIYVDNPNFEGPSIAIYALSNCTAELSNEQVYEGSQSLKLTCTVSAATPQVYLPAGSTTANRFLPGVTYTFSAWSYSPETNTGNGPRIRIGGALMINGEGSNITIKGRWVRHVLTFTTSLTAIPLVGLSVSNGVGDVTYWDKATIVIGSEARDFSGDSPNAAWLAPYTGAVMYDVNARDLAYIEKNYWAKLSGLSEPASLADHKLAALRANIKTVAGDPLTVVDRNYILDPTCENASLPGINSSRGTVARSNAKVKSGTYAVEFTSDASVGGKYIVWLSSGRKLSVTPGDLITFKFSFAKDAAASAGSIASRIYFLDSLGSFGSPSGGPNIAFLDTFSDYTYQVVVPAGAATIQVETIFSSSTIPAGDKFYFDEIYLGINGQGNYFNPDTNFSRWQGTNNNSVSELVDGSKNSITDLWVSYLMSRSGLNPASKYALHEHELAFYKSQLGL